MYARKIPLSKVSLVSISKGLGGVENNDLKKFIINLRITKIENTKKNPNTGWIRLSIFFCFTMS
jgi:hypothetical protein